MRAALLSLLLSTTLTACAPPPRSACGGACLPAKAIAQAPAGSWNTELLIAFVIALAACAAL